MIFFSLSHISNETKVENVINNVDFVFAFCDGKYVL